VDSPSLADRGADTAEEGMSMLRTLLLDPPRIGAGVEGKEAWA
jgi:hypothetical protein